MADRQKHLDCIDVVELVSDYLDGAGSAEERVALEQHFLICGGCMRYVDQVRATVEAARETKEPAEPPEELRKLFRAFQASKKP
jgi:predicted anti-sigma-YlaC factor YlaD